MLFGKRIVALRKEKIFLSEDIGNGISYWFRKSEYGNDELAKMLDITKKSFDDICDGTAPIFRDFDKTIRNL